MVQTTLRYEDFQNADEIFSSGNFAKLAPVVRIDERQLPIGPDFAHGMKRAA